MSKITDSKLHAYAEQLVLGGCMQRALASATATDGSSGSLCSKCLAQSSLPGTPLHLRFFDLCEPCFAAVVPLCTDISADAFAICRHAGAAQGASGVSMIDAPYNMCHSNFGIAVEALKDTLLSSTLSTNEKFYKLRGRTYLEPDTLCPFIGTQGETEVHLMRCARVRVVPSSTR